MKARIPLALLGPVRLLYVDPPWRASDQLPGPGRGASKHYRTMSTDELCSMNLPPLADDCMLAMWRIASMQPDALRVIEAWGFTLKTEIVWVKQTVHGKRWFGMGRYVRAEHETCLIATRGRVKVANRSTRSVLVAKAAKAGHSTKPVEMYALLEGLMPEGPRLELFARERRAGWLSDGDQLDDLADVKLSRADKRKLRLWLTTELVR